MALTSFSLTMARSMPSSSPNSLTMTAMRRPCCAVRMCRTSVDLPPPRKPFKEQEVFQGRKVKFGDVETCKCGRAAPSGCAAPAWVCRRPRSLAREATAEVRKKTRRPAGCRRHVSAKVASAGVSSGFARCSTRERRPMLMRAPGLLRRSLACDEGHRDRLVRLVL